MPFSHLAAEALFHAYRGGAKAIAQKLSSGSPSLTHRSMVRLKGRNKLIAHWAMHVD